MTSYTHYNADLTRIKRVCNILSTETAFDDDLGQALQDAYVFINNAIGKYTTVPLGGSIPDMILSIEADIGGGRFKESKVVPAEGERVKKHIFRERGEAALLEYIATNYEGDQTDSTTDSLYWSGYRRDAEKDLATDNLENLEDDYL